MFCNRLSGKGRIKLLLLMFCVALVGCKKSQNAHQFSNEIPAYLVGVWATEDSIMDGSYLFEGSAVYLDSDGVGAIVGGPPAIGLEIVAKFKTSSNTILYEMIENDKKVGKGKILYNPDLRTLTLEPNANIMRVVLYRCFDEFSDDIRENLRLEFQNTRQ